MTQEVKVGDIVCHRGDTKYKLLLKFPLPGDLYGDDHGFLMESLSDPIAKDNNRHLTLLRKCRDHLINNIDFQAMLDDLEKRNANVDWEFCRNLNDPEIYEIVSGYGEEDHGGLQYL